METGYVWKCKKVADRRACGRVPSRCCAHSVAASIGVRRAGCGHSRAGTAASATHAANDASQRRSCAHSDPRRSGQSRRGSTAANSFALINPGAADWQGCGKSCCSAATAISRAGRSARATARSRARSATSRRLGRCKWLRESVRCVLAMGTAVRDCQQRLQPPDHSRHPRR